MLDIKKYFTRRWRKTKLWLTKIETPRPKCCVICSGTKLVKSFIHTEWKKRCWKCVSCGHIALYDTDNVDSNHFSTNMMRANNYLSYLGRGTKAFNSLLEVGAPDDFYFLTEAHIRWPHVKLYAYDIFPKKNVPDFIEMVSKIDEKHADLIYATHVLEHMPDPKTFLDYLVGRLYIVEVPFIDEWWVKNIKKGKAPTKYHYQFFTEKSFKILFPNHYIYNVRTTDDGIIQMLVSKNL